MKQQVNSWFRPVYAIVNWIIVFGLALGLSLIGHTGLGDFIALLAVGVILSLLMQVIIGDPAGMVYRLGLDFLVIILLAATFSSIPLLFCKVT